MAYDPCVCVRYDHLAGCLSRVLDERPNNAVGMCADAITLRFEDCFKSLFPDMFENLSLSVKKERYRSPQDTLGERDPPSEVVEVAEKQTQLYEAKEIYVVKPTDLTLKEILAQL